MKAKPHDVDSWEKRVSRYMEALGNTLDSYEADHPNWFVDTVFELIGGGLRSLRHCIENIKDKAVTWNTPIAEFHYPVEWNWEAWQAGDQAAILQMYGRLDAEALRSRRKAVHALSRIALQTRNVFVLNTLTKHVAWQRRRKRWTPIFAQEIGDALAKLPRSQQQHALTDLYRPFSVGAFEVDFDANAFSLCGRVSARARKALANGMNKLDMPPITFSGEADGEPFTLSLVAQFRPFVVDVDAREAYFPIVVGLVFHPTAIEVVGVHEGQPVLMPKTPDPTAWSKKDRKGFWDALLKEWDGATRPKSRGYSAADRADKAAIDVMFKARVVPFDENPHAAIMHDAVASLRQHGRVEHISFDLRPVQREPASPAANIEEKIASGRFDVFLAHNSKDKALVSRIAEHLKRRGIYPWLDQEQVPPGRRFQKLLQEAIRRAPAVAMFIGANGLGPWQDLELDTFIQECVRKKIPIIPVLLPGQDSIPRALRFLRGFTIVRFAKTVHDRKALDDLHWGITGRRLTR